VQDAHGVTILSEVKALDLVKKVQSLARARREGTSPRAPLAQIAAVKLIQATTAITRGMQRLAIPAPRPGERVALSVAAAQLRAMVDHGLVTTTSTDPNDPEVALATLVGETLALVDKVLAMDPELARAAKKPELHAHVPASDDEIPPTKISF
jgi:hypothetical protein